jgi:hypothetical protein
MRMEGAMPLANESRAAFEETTETYYRSFYDDSTTRRRLAAVDVSSFDTLVAVTGEALDGAGNTITYNQTITFVADQDSVDARAAARSLLETPLSTETQREEYLQLLREANEEFESVTAVAAPNIPGEEVRSSEGANVLLVVLVTVGGLLCCYCCCWGGLLGYTEIFRQSDARPSLYATPPDENKGYSDDGDRTAAWTTPQPTLDEIGMPEEDTGQWQLNERFDDDSGDFP